jgi:UDP-N-acetylmuramoyl-L-alanyl-D-glutamate--2,6-diaminopimelate ligase
VKERSVDAGGEPRVLAAGGRRPGLLGTIESRVGGERRPALRTTPEAIDLQRSFREMLDGGDRSCALEATSHGSALGRLNQVRFRTLVFTNLTQDHLDFHVTLDAYRDAKARLFRLLAAGAKTRRAAVVNADDPAGAAMVAGRDVFGFPKALGWAPQASAGERARTPIGLGPCGNRP